MADGGIISAIEPTTPVGISAPIILWSKAQPVFGLNDRAASGADADAVHDMRVASRRTREALAIFEPMYRTEEYEWVQKMVKRVTRALGPVRDADVFIEEFGCLMGKLPGEDTKRALAYLIGYVAGDRAVRLRAMQADLRKLDLGGRRQRFERALHDFRRNAEVQVPLRDYAATVIPARLEAVLSHLPAALTRENAPDQHEMRIAIKHLRYAVETFRSVYGGDFKDIYRLLTELQDTLGNLHDRDVFISLARDAEEQADASKAEVSAVALERVITALGSEREDFFTRFTQLMTEYQPNDLRVMILGPLGMAPEPEPQPAPVAAAQENSAPIVTPPPASLGVLPGAVPPRPVQDAEDAAAYEAPPVAPAAPAAQPAPGVAPSAPATDAVPAVAPSAPAAQAAPAIAAPVPRIKESPEPEPTVDAAPAAEPPAPAPEPSPDATPPTSPKPTSDGPLSWWRRA